MKTFADVCKFIESRIRRQAVLVETGCTYSSSPDALVHTSTNNLASLADAKHGILYSFDNDRAHIIYAQELVTERAPVLFLHGDSVQKIREWKGYAPRADLVCFDSVNDPDHMMAEYEAIKDHLQQSHFILVDDIHNPNAVKWKKLVPHLKELGYKGIEIPTPTGLFLTAKGYPLE